MALSQSQKDRSLHFDPSNFRDAPPTHYTLKVQSFSLLSKASIERFDSDVFEVGGYKWKLSVYPDGNKIGNGNDHISLYLVLAETSSLPLGWEVNVIFNLFLFEQFQDKYLTFQDRRVKRFHAMKTEWGMAKFVDLKSFKDQNNGYLVNDSCVFGAEVFVLKNEAKRECLSMSDEEAVICTHIWKIEKFSGVATSERLESDAFAAGDYKWRIKIYPKGNRDGKGNSISLFIALADSTTLPPDTKLYVKLALCVKDQASDAHYERQVCHLFSPSVVDWGWAKFMTLGKFSDPTKCYLRNDTCIIEARVTVLGSLTNKLPATGYCSLHLLDEILTMFNILFTTTYIN
ncbi:PREDICTED: uncharacterized protein LOC104611282 [Nelumbo nucifera]|uniref:MATH domain-containing protein n=2 Tax=Nelumbo nucifera TaxID=4432 RepID=A0A822YK57_NELNU|nr:PREDICTED: uncharacterized protein LOC104611282 [Nelumbo nucifera]DAD32980.1 TPA_asm: hypothetical protein HUJ06_011831 [Nelumbo nucifera]